MHIIEIIIVIPLFLTSFICFIKSAFFLPKELEKGRKIYYRVSFAAISIGLIVLIVALATRK